MTGMETYMSIGELAAYLKCSRATIRRFVLHRAVPYHKIYKSVRFRLSEIEKWIDEGGVKCRAFRVSEDGKNGDLFAENGKPKNGETGIVAGEERAESETAASEGGEGADGGQA